MKPLKLFISLNLSICLVLTTFTTHASQQVIEKVAAIVNNNVILESDVNEMLQSIKASNVTDELPDDKTLRHQIMERLIIQNLILQKASKAKIKVSDNEVDEAIKNIASENNLTVAELRSKLSLMGISYDSYRNRIYDDMLIEQTRMDQVRPRIIITEKEVDNLTDLIAKQPTNNIDVNISHILIAVPENATREQINKASNLANDVFNRAKKGENFAKLATAYSNDDFALKGGKMGWQKINELPSIFEERLIRAPKNSIVGPLRSGVGFHILKVDDLRSEAPKVITTEEVNARHILIQTNVLVSDEQAQQKLNEIRQSIEKGKQTFEAAAKTYSQDPGSADKGGNLGWNNPDRYDVGFKKALLNLKNGEISKPIQSSFGWHLIQLIDSRKVDKTTAVKKEQAYRLIFNRKFAEEAQVWIQEIKADAYIKIMDDDTNE